MLNTLSPNVEIHIWNKNSSFGKKKKKINLKFAQVTGLLSEADFKRQD